MPYLAYLINIWHIYIYIYRHSSSFCSHIAPFPMSLNTTALHAHLQCMLLVTSALVLSLTTQNWFWFSRTSWQDQSWRAGTHCGYQRADSPPLSLRPATIPVCQTGSTVTGRSNNITQTDPPNIEYQNTWEQKKYVDNPLADNKDQEPFQWKYKNHFNQK